MIHSGYVDYAKNTAFIILSAIFCAELNGGMANLILAFVLGRIVVLPLDVVVYFLKKHDTW